MKKVFIALCLSLIVFCSHAQNTADKVSSKVDNGISALHEDSKRAISTLHEDASKIVETAYTDGKSVLGVVYNDVNKIVQYATPKLEAGLIALAQTLKTTVAEVYEAMVRKQIAVAISNLFYGILAFIFLYLSYRIIKLPEETLTHVSQYGNTVWKGKWIASILVTGGAFLSFLIAFGLGFQDMIIGFYAPKYGAIQEIVKIVDTLMK